jgi:hypothetical protein
MKRHLRMAFWLRVVIRPTVFERQGGQALPGVARIHLVGCHHKDITFPTSVCHSPEDGLLVVTYENVPFFDENRNVVEFVSSIPGLNIQGNHQVAHILLCPLDPVMTDCSVCSG